MRYWEHPDWPAMAAAVREAGAWGPAADWIEEVCDDEATARRVRTLAQPDSSHPVWWAAAKALADGWASDLIPGVDHRRAEVMELQRTVLVGELYLAIQNGFVRRVVATGRHLHALHQICRREPVAEVIVCGPLWMERGRFDESGLTSDRKLGQVKTFDAQFRIPDWPGGGIGLRQRWTMSEREWQADPRLAQDRLYEVRRQFIRGCQPDALLAGPIVPPGPRVEWAREADRDYSRPYQPGGGPYLPEEMRAIILGWDRIARWHANHPDGGRSLFDDYGGHGQGATWDNSPYALFGRELTHTVVRT